MNSGCDCSVGVVHRSLGNARTRALILPFIATVRSPTLCFLAQDRRYAGGVQRGARPPHPVLISPHRARNEPCARPACLKSSGEYRQHGNDTISGGARFAPKSCDGPAVAQQRRGPDEVCRQICKEGCQALKDRLALRHVDIGRRDVALFEVPREYVKLGQKRPHPCLACASRPLLPVEGLCRGKARRLLQEPEADPQPSERLKRMESHHYRISNRNLCHRPLAFLLTRRASRSWARLSGRREF